MEKEVTGVKWRQSFQDLSLRTKMLVVILPLIVIPMLVLAAVGFVTSSREAATTSTRFLNQRENDLRTIVENPAIRDYFNNRFYDLNEEAEVYRREIERSLKRFTERSNSIEPIYPQVRYVDHEGKEIAEVVDGELSRDLGLVAEAPFFVSTKDLRPGQFYRSPVGPRMTYAMPVYESSGSGGSPTFQGAVVLDFVYPLKDFQRITEVIAGTFVVTTALSLGIAIFLVVNRVQRLTHPIRRLADAANVIASGQRAISVEIDSKDEIGRLAHNFNDMAVSLEENEQTLKRKAEEATALYEIGQEITAQVTLEPTLHLIVERVRTLLQADTSLLALRQEGSDTFAIRAHSGTVSEGLTGVLFNPGEGLGGRVVARGKAMVVGDYPKEFADSPFLHLIQEAGYRSVIAVPLKVHAEVVGVLYVFSRMPNRFSDQGLQFLDALATQATISIENAKLYQQVRQHAEQLETKVEERTKELQEANLKLQTTSRHKSEFLANMSHELRTPMNAIIGFTRLVMRRSKEQLPTKQYENLQKILVSANHLLGLINDILDLSKIEAGRLDLRPVDFVLDPLVEECLRTVETMVNERTSVVKDIEADLPTLFTDMDKLKQILVNLLSNAVKFTEKGTITVVARRRDDRVAIDVIDTGIGIPEDALRVIFEEFHQLDSSVTRHYGGTGLGLSICSHLARLMGGEIKVRSVVGEGSTFNVTIPVRHEVLHTAKLTAPAPAAQERAGRPMNGKVVLAIDDDPDAIYLLRENLAEAGYHVVGAMSGEEGLQKARELRPFAITLDILMPNKDGWQVLHDLKVDATTRDIPVIMLSIVDQKDLGYRLDVFDYLLKPFSREEVLAVLTRIKGAHARLLVVDDDPQIVDMVRQLLEGEPYEVEAAMDGQAALEMIAQRPPDVVLLDLLMPRMDGFAVIECLHKDPSHRDIPVVVLTAKTLTTDDEALLEEHVHQVIDKRGIERAALIRELQLALHSYQSPEFKV